MTFGSLFAGIGGLDLGLERAGMTCKWQVEIDDYATKVLTRHWPDVPKWRDIRTFPPDTSGTGNTNGQERPGWVGADEYGAEWRVDLICGGFPCQDISYAGRGAGLDGERSGLFFEAIRVIRELGPRYVLLENVAALLTRGLDDVLGTLASIGFDAEWHCIPAAAVGAPHIRDRVFIIGSMADAGCDHVEGVDERRGDRDIAEKMRRRNHQLRGSSVDDANGRCSQIDTTPKAMGETCPICKDFCSQYRCAAIPYGECDCPRCQGLCECNANQWSTEPDVGRVAHGVPSRVDRLRGLGNAVVPQVAEYIGKQIMRSEATQ